jgi:hypothetical protein
VKKCGVKIPRNKTLAIFCFSMAAISLAASIYAQAAAAGFNETNTKVRSYFQAGVVGVEG